MERRECNHAKVDDIDVELLWRNCSKDSLLKLNLRYSAVYFCVVKRKRGMDVRIIGFKP